MAAPVFSLACAAYGAGARQRPHSHEELQITVVLVGGVEEHVGAAVERATALSVVVKDPGVVHDDVFGRSGALTARLSLPATTFTDLVEHPRRAGAWRWSHDARVALPFLRLVRRGVEGEQHFPGDDDDVLDFLAAISARLAAPHHPDAPRWLADAVQGVQEDWRPGLTVRDVARLAGVHPVYFAR